MLYGIYEEGQKKSFFVRMSDFILSTLRKKVFFKLTESPYGIFVELCRYNGKEHNKKDQSIFFLDSMSGQAGLYRFYLNFPARKYLSLDGYNKISLSYPEE